MGLIFTPDALHLASILTWDQGIDRLTVASCDTRVRDNAHALGFDLLPPSGSTQSRVPRL
jgi:hypothetical protein